MAARKIILFSTESESKFPGFKDAVASISDERNILRHHTIEEIEDAIYRNIADDPLIIITVNNEKELAAFSTIAQLLQRFDLALIMPPEAFDASDIRKSGYGFRPRLVFDFDEDPRNVGLLLEGLLTKKNKARSNNLESMFDETGTTTRRATINVDRG